MSIEIANVPLYLLFTGLGFLLKFAFDRYAEHKDSVRFEAWKVQANNLEARLSKFYWPLHCRLQRGSMAWESDNHRSNKLGKDKDRFAKSFDEGVIIQNHKETRKIIQDNFHLYGGDYEIEEKLIRLLHHIDIYLSLRDSGIEDIDPMWLGEPWPQDIESLIEQKLHKLQRDYDTHLAKASSLM